MKRRILASMVMMMLLGAFALHAQQTELGGRRYVIAYPDTVTNKFDPRYPNTHFTDGAYLIIYSVVDNEVRITGRQYERTETMLAGKFAVVDLMDPDDRASRPIIDGTGRIQGGTFSVDSDEPVVIYCYLLTKYGTEAWTPLPVESWGKEYLVSARPGEIANDISTGGEFDYNKKSKAAPAQITILAAFDNTVVTIPADTLFEGVSGTLTISLDAGDAYQIQSYVDTTVYADRQIDIGGLRITSTEVIGVMSGNTRAQVLWFQEGLAQNIYKNMLVEWLAPVEQHGTEFVYMPTWDTRRPTGTPGERLDDKRKGEHVRIYASTSGTTTTGYSLDNVNGRTDFTVGTRGSFREDFLGAPEARYYKTNRPALAMMNSGGVVRYNGTTQGFGGYIGAEFDGWSAYMVEMVPRQQWTGFAPYYAPGNPSGMDHHINVVTDSAHQNDVYMESGDAFVFNRGAIAGSGLVWGTMQVTTDRIHFLEGRNGATFSGFVYGIYKGHEEFLPGSARREEDPEGAGARAGDRSDGELLHPAQFIEYASASYGYPLAPSRLLIAVEEDTMMLEPARRTMDVDLLISMSRPGSVGLRSIVLDSAVNTRIASLEPANIIGRSRATLRLAPIDSLQPAYATVVVTDRAGRVRRYSYESFTERMSVAPSGEIDFGVTTFGLGDVERTVTLANIDNEELIIGDLRLLSGDQGFSIESRPSLPYRSRVGSALDITIKASVADEARLFHDTLLVRLESRTILIPVRIEASRPTIDARDVEFGVVARGMSVERTLQICNTGPGTLFFSTAPGGRVIEWSDSTTFTIAPSEMEKLRSAMVGPDSCMGITVRFLAPIEDGPYVQTVRIGSNALQPDTSVWRAVVSATGNVIEEITVAGLRILPNPVYGSSMIRFTLARGGNAVLEIHDALGNRIETLDRGYLPAGEQALVWDPSSLPSGVYRVVVRVGEWSGGGTVVVVR